MKTKLYGSIICLLFCFFIQAQKTNHSKWHAFLQKYISNEGKVNYEAIKENSIDLNTYLQELSEIKINDNWSKNEKLAFWINAYNAFTIKLIIDNYPLKSIKDIQKPWDKEFIKMGSNNLSLNYIEHDILRRMDEPRIHFAIVCASVSCPKLNNKAYTAENLETQLTQATKDFLSDSNRNSISKDYLELSKIFKWFGYDFTKNGSLIDFLKMYSGVQISKDAKIKFKDYNWDLND